MNLQELAKMTETWPEGTPEVISQAYETRRAKLQQAQREQQPFTVPKKKDYGSEYPEDSLTTKVVLSLGLLVVVSFCIIAFFKVLQGAVDGLMDHSRQVAIEGREVQNGK